MSRASLDATCAPQRVLAKKRDPLTHTLFLDEVGGGGPAAAGREGPAGLPIDAMW